VQLQAVSGGQEEAGAMNKESNMTTQNPLPVIYQDITSITSGVIVQQVNCQGVMGSGLAAAIARKWPEVKERYTKFCDFLSPLDCLGEVIYQNVSDKIIIANCFGQLTFGRTGRHTDYLALKNCLKKIDGDFGFRETFGSTIHIPLNIGAGLGGGDPEVTHQIIRDVFGDEIGRTVKLYELPIS
jgi:O-acetyl-ADP-ribose deacetylase (regulator of RNase III)